VESEEAVTRNAASTENTQSHTQRRWPLSVRSSVNPSRFHSFTVESLDVVTRYLRARGVDIRACVRIVASQLRLACSRAAARVLASAA